MVLSMARMGVAKTDQTIVKCKTRYSRFIYTPTRKNIFIKNKLSYSQSQIPNKTKQNPNFTISNHLSYPISSKPTKIKHFPSFTTQKSNHHLTKNLPTNPKLSLFISTFTDNDFSSKNSKSHPQHRGYHKTTHKTIKTVIALSYFLCKKQNQTENI